MLREIGTMICITRLGAKLGREKPIDFSVKADSPTKNKIINIFLF